MISSGKNDVYSPFFFAVSTNHDNFASGKRSYPICNSYMTNLLNSSTNDAKDCGLFTATEDYVAVGYTYSGGFLDSLDLTEDKICDGTTFFFEIVGGLNPNLMNKVGFK